MTSGVLLSKIWAHRRCFYELFVTCSYGEAWLPCSPSGLLGWGIRFLLFWWFCDFRASSLLEVVDLGATIWLLFDVAYCIVFPCGGALCKLPSKRSNLSYIACKFCCWTMLYILFNNSCLPCILRLALNIWKQDNSSSFEVEGGIICLIWGIRVDPAIWRGWSRYGCNGVFVILRRWMWLIDRRLSSSDNAITSCNAAEQVALNPTVVEKLGSQESRNSENQGWFTI